MKNNSVIALLLISKLTLTSNSENNQRTNTSQNYSVIVQYVNGELADPNDNDAQDAQKLLDQEIEQGMSVEGLQEVVLDIDCQTEEIVMTAVYDYGCAVYHLRGQ